MAAEPTPGWSVPAWPRPAAGDVRLRRRRSLALFALLLDAAVVVGVWVLIRYASDRWWPATLILFGPRWVWALPSLAVAPLLALWRPRLLVGLLVVLLFVAGPMMGFCVPWRTLGSAPATDFHLRVLTCNVHRGAVAPPALADLIDTLAPDVVVLQDWASRDAPGLGHRTDWHRRRDDELYVATRFPLLDTELYNSRQFSEGRGSLARYALETPIGTLAFFNTHLNSPRQAFEEVIDHRFRQGDALQHNSDLRREQAQTARAAMDRVRGPVLMAGDFNTPVESPTYRTAFGEMMNAFSAAGWGIGHTYFTRRFAMRIDQIVAGPGWRCRRCWVGPAVGSPHRPLIADLDWVAAPAGH